MKRCPTCTRTFIDEHLTYCTDDGTPLVEQVGSSSYDPQAAPFPDRQSPTSTIKEPPPTEVYRAGEIPGGYPQPYSWAEPTSARPPAQTPAAAPYQAPAWNEPPARAWNPPPPPRYNATKTQNPLALASLAAGVFSITLGLFCFGFLTAPIAIVLGIIALTQIKNNPAQSGTKGLAIAGIATGAAALVISLLLLILSIIF